MFSIIVAIGKNNEIGKDNKLLWNIPEDLQNFRKITLNKKIIMGRKTYESIGKPLPKRENIILTRNEQYEEIENLKVYNNIDEIIKVYGNLQEEIFVIGGEQIYKEFLERNLVEKMYISHIDFTTKDADAYFPKIVYDKWKIEKEEEYSNWKFCIYNKI